MPTAWNSLPSGSSVAILSWHGVKFLVPKDGPSGRQSCMKLPFLWEENAQCYCHGWSSTFSTIYLLIWTSLILWKNEFDLVQKHHGDPQHGRTKSGHIAMIVPASQWVRHHAFCWTVNSLKAGSVPASPVLFVSVFSTWLVLDKLLNG